MADFFDDTADVASGEEEEEEVDDEGQPARRSKNADMNDSSEEEDDDDEEAEREIREGFIVDEDEDDEDTKQRKRERREERRKRRREEAEDDILDDEDLDLIGETLPDREGPSTQKSKYKRLKRGHREERPASEARGVEDIFSDDEDGGDGAGAARSRGAFGAAFGDEMDDFIEEDEFPDDEGERLREDLEIRQPSKGGFLDNQNLKESGLNEGDLEDMRGAFGDGNEFEWALEVEKELLAAEERPDRDLELKDVFEPSQLVEKMLTDDDNKIRATDVPERLQIARKPYKDLSDLSEEEQAERMIEETKWISNTMFPQQQLPSSLREPFEQAVGKVLHFMNVEDYEPAFIFQNRKDYLIHSEQVPLPPDPSDPGAPAYEIKAVKLLSQTNLWELMDYDLKYRAFAEKRDGIRKSVEMLKEMFPDFNDTIFDDLMPDAVEIEDLQDLQDYLNFQYSQQLKDLSTVESEANGTQKRARGTRSVWDKVRAGNAYHLVRAFGITADAFAQNTSKIGRKNYTEDPDVRPDDMADTLVQEPEYRTGKEVLASARAMFVEEIASNPRLRKHLRKMYVEYMVFDAVRTDKGLKQIDAEHPYYEFKYLRNQGIRNFFSRPDLFLRMLKAEQDGLIEIKVRLQNERRILDELTKGIESDNFSEVADAWNALRREVVGQAFGKLHRVIAKGWKDHMRNMCEGKIANECREAYSLKLDQAPYKPKGMVLGTTPRVLALSNGAGDRADAICWAYVDENGRVLENGKFTDMRLGNAEKYTSDGKDVAPFVELVERRKPDVVAVSGWSVETRRLYKDLQDIVEKHSLQGTPYEDPEDDREVSDPLEIFMVNDEVARLYHTSARAAVDHPSVPPLTRYSIALAMYMQNPMKEYASLGRDITSITFDASQHLIPEDKLIKALDSAMVDMVNLVGIDINDAVNDVSTARLLPYICGLGPRKAAHMLKLINSWGGEVSRRDQLAAVDTERGVKSTVGPVCWVNCISFLYVMYEATENDTDYLDNTRIHPEDYDVARKIAADALEFDEEDIKNEVDQNGPAAVVKKLIQDEAQDKVNDLLLDEYAAQLEAIFGNRKRATLELIRAELQNPFEELRRNFEYLSSMETFTMMTGETQDSLQEGMIIPVSVKRTSPDHIEVKLDCGVDGNISSSEFPDEVTNNQLEPRQVWPIHQVIRAKITHIDRKKLHAQMTMRDNEMKNPFRRQFDHDYGEWDEDQEARDQREAKRATQKQAGRIQRVVKHSLFRPYNSHQAEAELSQPNVNRGDCIIRPSSKGADHLAVTWKVHDNVYQHIDVLELDKENEYSVGRTLRVGKFSYSDLDELIVLHVKAMAKKVDEMCGDEKYQNLSKEALGKLYRRGSLNVTLINTH
jgi:transcription elongation factor SPT6